MILRLLLFFTLIPLAELYLLLVLADLTGVITTVALVIGTGVIGTILARRQGLQAWHRFRLALAEGRVPNREIQDGLLIVCAAALLVTPGLLSDTAGFLLLIPTTRGLVRRYMAARLAGSFHASTRSFPHSGAGGIRGATVDAEGVRPTDDSSRPERPVDRLHNLT